MMKKTKYWKKRVTKQIFNEVKKIIESYDIKYRIRFDTGECWARPADDYIQVGLEGHDNTIQYFLSVVFHEMLHVLNYRDYKYRAYHHCGNNTRTTKKLLKALIRTGWKAERYTDAEAKKLMKIYYPEIPFSPGYPSSYKKIYDKDWIASYKDLLKVMK